MTIVILKLEFSGSCRLERQWQNLANSLFLCNCRTNNDLDTFKIFQRTRIEEEDEVGAANLLSLGLSQNIFLM